MISLDSEEGFADFSDRSILTISNVYKTEKPYRRWSPIMAPLRFSTRIRVASSPQMASQPVSKRLECRSAWMDEDDALTTFSLNGCGVRSSMS